MDLQTAEQKAELERLPEYQEKTTKTPYLFLTCDLPPMPLFSDDKDENIIPQVPLFTLLQKFNGIQEKEYKTYKDSTLKRFELTQLPPYLLLNMKVYPFAFLALFPSTIAEPFSICRGLTTTHFSWRRIRRSSTFLSGRYLGSNENYYNVGVVVIKFMVLILQRRRFWRIIKG